MRTWLHLALWGAVFLGACSSGGPGGLISFQNVREAPSYTNESPGPGGGETIEVGEGANPNNNNPNNNGGRDASVNVPDVNIPDVNVERPDTSVKIDSGGGEAGGSFTCTDLQDCCDSLSGTEQTQCQQAHDSASGNNSTCSSFLTAIKENGRCL